MRKVAKSNKGDEAKSRRSRRFLTAGEHDYSLASPVYAGVIPPVQPTKMKTFAQRPRDGKQPLSAKQTLQSPTRLKCKPHGLHIETLKLASSYEIHSMRAVLWGG